MNNAKSTRRVLLLASVGSFKQDSHQQIESIEQSRPSASAFTHTRKHDFAVHLLDP